MKFSVASTLFLATSAIAGRSPQHVNKKLPERMRREPANLPAVGLDKRAATKKKHHIIPQNKNTTSTYQHSRCGSGPGLHIRPTRLW
jgi:carboxypeptidase D